MSLVTYELADRVAVLTLNRPEARNAQSQELLRELDAGWRRAKVDPEVRVIVVRAEGKHFSAGHDMGVTKEELYGPDPGVGPAYRAETDKFFDLTRRWRNVPKPSIASVQGACIAAGLMLAWPCDLIIASDDAFFSDPTVVMGTNGSSTTPTPGSSAPAKPRSSCSPQAGSLPKMPNGSGWSIAWFPVTSWTRKPWSWLNRSP
jgi:enoyl-CoA hydratase/carnithine racemase